MSDLIFSLDIGTRKIAALVASVNRRDYGDSVDNDAGGVIEILASRIEEHDTRRVRAGLIHDIDGVARDVIRIKESLEKECGVKLNKVATAIAGRGMRSFRATGELQLGSFRQISSEDLRNAEMIAIRQVITTTTSRLKSSIVGSSTEGVGREENCDIMDEYYFIGYTPVLWEVDGEPITKPIGHCGTSLKVEIIAAFLPRKVLESLFEVLKKANLELTYLTLEPIAATEGVLSDDMKHIPIVLVDIGAGTSDIAVIRKGAIQSFAMIPEAGDSITEFICSEYLVDFSEAERIKRCLSSLIADKNTTQGLTFRDIFGIEYEKSGDEIIKIIMPAITSLAEKISGQIKQITSDMASDSLSIIDRTHDNNTHPSSHHQEDAAHSSRLFLAHRPNYGIVLVGGGALTPSIIDALSLIMNMSPEKDVRRIGIRQPSMLKKFHGLKGDLSGPNAAVVLGVAVLAAKYPTAAIIHILINGEKKEIINFSYGHIPQTILSALIASGISKQKILGRPGLALSFTVNEELRIIKGGMPRPSKVYLNEREVSLDERVKDGDRITFVAAHDGANASAKIKDILDENETFFFNGIRKRFPALIRMNGMTVDENADIVDNCKINIEYIRALRDVLSSCCDVQVGNFSKNHISANVNGNDVKLTSYNWRLSLNGAEVDDLSDKILMKPQDRIDFEWLNNKFCVADFIDVPPPKGRDLRVLINGEEFVFQGGPGRILINGKEADMTTPVADGDIIRTIPGKDAEAILVDVFKYISVDPTDNMGKKIKLLVNSQDANFTTPLFEGAEVKIGWE